MSHPVHVFYDDRMLLHSNGPGHPERPDRLKAIVRELRHLPDAMLRWREPRLATITELRRAHTIGHVDKIDGVKGVTCRLDPDTGVSPGSWEAAYLAAGAAMQAVETVCSDETKRAVALVRPPGHHAEREKAMGFCLFNNAAVAAEHARQALGLERVMIVDFDVHHCNGTQHIFYDRADVLVMSCHRYPFYPGTGALVELGEGEGKGYTVNLPLPAAVGDPTVLAGFEATLLQIAEAFDPQLILVSAGFDAHLFDPLGGLRMSEAGYGVLMGWLVEAANRTAAKGRLVTLLEGGYDLDALSRSMRVCTEVMGGGTPPRLEFGEEEHALGLIDLYRQTHEPYWPVGYG